jgi:hypothetical protein
VALGKKGGKARAEGMSATQRQEIAKKGSRMRRFTRLTNAFSKKIENHAAAIALHTMHYNFVRIHQALRETPAMAAGVTDKLWEMDDLVAMLEQWELATTSRNINSWCADMTSARATRSVCYGAAVT